MLTSEIDSATPSAAPNWRMDRLSALPTPKRSAGKCATAAPASEGSTMPTPTPLTSMPGSQSPT